MSDPSRIPVIVGVGQIADRPENDADGLDALQLMVAAVGRADAGDGWTARCDWLAIVPQISFPAIDVAAALPAALAIAPAHVEPLATPSGDTPVRYLNDAANAIVRGEATVALIVGGEALRTASRRPAAAVPQPVGAIGASARRGASDLRRQYGLVSPTEIYPLYENASRAAWGQTLAEGQAETGEIWSLMSQVAAGADAAWIRKPVTAAEIVTPGASNRPIAFPYTKLMTANAGVNQSAALIVTSLAAAEEAGRRDQAIFIGAGAAAHEPDDALTRARWDRSPSMEVSLRETLAANALEPGDIDHVELYSCFPCVPKMARRIIDWPAEKPATVYGGLTFGGGPIGNYMTHGAAEMVNALRTSGRHGLLFGNGGYCTHNHSIVLSKAPPPVARFPQDYHRQTQADAALGAITPLTDKFEGVVTIETYTVVYGHEGEPRHGVILGRGPAGQRVIARIDPADAAGIAFLTDGAREPVGTAGRTARRNGILYWQKG